MKLSDIKIRDPFILADSETKQYYLYGTTPYYQGIGFYCFTSPDLVSWEGPFKVFTPPSDFWGTKDYWAPEVHFHEGAYYMFASFKGNAHARSTMILASDSPKGPFHLHSSLLTPEDWECLDGTFYIDEKKRPYMIFCHEWLQINDGTICAVPLSDDLKEAIGNPIVLFHGSDAKWSEQPSWADRPHVRVTDGPYVIESEDVHALLWSSYGKNGYRIGVAYPQDSIVSPDYVQEECALPIQSGGHGMVFRSFDRHNYLVVHVNNEAHGEEYPQIVPIRFQNGKCEVAK